MLKIPIINQSPYDLPSYATVSSAGMDLKAVLTSQVTLKPLERKIVKTGIFIELPVGFEAQVRPRSGLAFKKGERIEANGGDQTEVVLVSPNGTKYRITVDNSGNLSTTQVA